MISDDCDIEEAFGREGASAGGRLLFAAVTEQPKKVVARVAAKQPHDRFALPPTDDWVGGVIELRRLFMVDVRAVSLKPQARSVRLGPELSTQLAVTWAAYATRRGPLAGTKNAEKLARLVSADGIDLDVALVVAEAVAQTVAASWTFEVDGLDAAAVAFDKGEPSLPAEARLVETLRELADAATHAADALEGLRGDAHD